MDSPACFYAGIGRVGEAVGVLFDTRKLVHRRGAGEAVFFAYAFGRKP
jgi:hypothetical protein